MNRRLPVTLISGFLGAGKTSMLHHLISEHRGGHLAILVENPGPLNLDAKAIRGLCGAMRRTNDAVFEIPDGDAPAQVTAIANTLRDLSLSGRYERVLIELAGTASAAWLVDRVEAFSEWAEVNQTICVIDALDFYRLGKGAPSEASFWNLINEQILGATLLVLNKCDLLEEKELEFARAMLEGKNQVAPYIETAYGETPPDFWTRQATAKDRESAQRRLAAERKSDLIQPESFALSTALYRTHRPFHPERFSDWFNGEHPGLLRVKGLIWLATRNLLVGVVSRTTWQNSCGAAGIWWSALPREEWPEDADSLARMQETWREPYGDRRQELVLIGDAALLATTTRQQLDACLLTDEEYARPVKEWASFPDAFPAWDLEEG